MEVQTRGRLAHNFILDAVPSLITVFTRLENCRELSTIVEGLCSMQTSQVVNQSTRTWFSYSIRAL